MYGRNFLWTFPPLSLRNNKQRDSAASVDLWGKLIIFKQYTFESFLLSTIPKPCHRKQNVVHPPTSQSVLHVKPWSPLHNIHLKHKLKSRLVLGCLSICTKSWENGGRKVSYICERNVNVFFLDTFPSCWEQQENLEKTQICKNQSLQANSKKSKIWNILQAHFKARSDKGHIPVNQLPLNLPVHWLHWHEFANYQSLNRGPYPGQGWHLGFALSREWIRIVIAALCPLIFRTLRHQLGHAIGIKSVRLQTWKVGGAGRPR